MLGFVAATYANPYFYGYFNTPLPQTLALSVLLLLLFLTKRQTYSVIHLIVATLALVHVMTIPVLLLILLTISLGNLLSKTSVAKQDGRENDFPIGLYSLLLPVLLFVAYLISTIAIIPVVHYTQKILLFLSSLQEEAVRTQVAITEGLPRGILAPLNALGPSIVIGAILYYSIFYLRTMLAHGESNKWLGSIAVVALAFIIIGTLRQRFDTWGIAYYSISRYFALPGYALATVVASWIIANVFAHERGKWTLILLFAGLLSSALGGLLDPLAF
jgi:hypothetical protein